MASNNFFIEHNIPSNHIEKTVRTRSTLPHGVCKAPLDTSRSLKSLLLRRKQIIRIKDKLDGQPLILLAYV